MSDKKLNHDDFWDLSSLLPKKRPPVMRQTKPDVSAVSIDIEAPIPQSEKNTEKSIGSLSIRFREVSRENTSFQKRTDEISQPRKNNIQINIDLSVKSENKPKEVKVNNTPTARSSFDIPRREVTRNSRPTSELIDEYETTQGLIRRVRIMRWPTNYTFYEQFRSDARRCHSIEGKPAPRVEFFSYTPQYRQMTQAQLEFYFYWRSCFRRGEYLPADFSYVLLYVYEIINLHDVLPPEEGLSILSTIWINYRESHKALDKYLSEWVADFCLIHRLPPPTETLSPIMYAVLETTSFREFYMTGDTLDPETLISLSSNYIWQKSKYASPDKPENYKLYKYHLPRALGYVISHCNDDRFTESGMRPSRVSRDAFCGSLCAHNIKRRIDIEYLSYSRSTELRFLITDIVKYSENKLRSHLGIKSRLRVDGLEDKIKLLIDDYFRAEFPNDRRRSSKADEAAAEERYYDAMYGALSVGIDTDAAKEIEASSWTVTDRLTLDAADDEINNTTEVIDMVSDIPEEPFENIETDTVTSVSEIPSPTHSHTDESTKVYSKLHVLFICAAKDGNAAEIDSLCRSHNRYPDELASEINEIAVDDIGDIILEPDSEGSYRTIEDYEAEIEEIIRSIRT